jgi:AcrR family transcriptional regulator
MTPEQTSLPSRPGRPRSERAREAILAAAAELLLSQGLDAVSMDAVAERAGVSKATIYRWWRSKKALAMDALYNEWTPTGEIADTGSLRGDLIAILRPWLREMRSRPYGMVIAALITERHTDPAFAREYTARLTRPRRDRARVVFVRAMERGEIDPSVDVEVALDLVYGALYHRILHGHAPLTDRFMRDLVDHTLVGLLPRNGSVAERREARRG